MDLLTVYLGDGRTGVVVHDVEEDGLVTVGFYARNDGEQVAEPGELCLTPKTEVTPYLMIRSDNPTSLRVARDALDEAIAKLEAKNED